MVCRLFWDGSNTLWAVAKCRECGEVHKFLAEDAQREPVRCRSCGREVDLREVVRNLIEAGQTTTPPTAAADYDICRWLRRQRPGHAQADVVIAVSRP